MNILIMSRGRAGKVNTLNWIPPSWWNRTWVICSQGEYIEYREKVRQTVGIVEAPEKVTNYSQKFQWILDGFTKKIEPIPGYDLLDVGIPPKALIMDDDLVFSQFSSEGKLLTQRDPEKLAPMFEQIEKLLDTYALVGVHPRQNAQNTQTLLNPREFMENGRIICIQGINREKIGPVKVDQFPILADVILNCTLLSRGMPNALVTSFFQDHGPCQAPGGCSIYRTPDMQRAAVEYLASRWPGFVKVVERHPKTAKWMGDTRYDYQCQWKRLYATGVAHLLDPGKVPNPDTEARRVPSPVE